DGRIRETRTVERARLRIRAARLVAHIVPELVDLHLALRCALRGLHCSERVREVSVRRRRDATGAVALEPVASIEWCAPEDLRVLEIFGFEVLDPPAISVPALQNALHVGMQ